MSTLCWSQNKDSPTVFGMNYEELVQYSPKGFKVDLIFKPKNKRLLSIKLNSIVTLQVYYEHQKEFKLTNAEIMWLEKQIDHIAVAFYLEGKPIFMRKVGGYSGCSDKMLSIEMKNGKEVAVLDFCYSCTDFSIYARKFIDKFNYRMKRLMETE